MAGATLTTLANILKEYYLPPVREQLNNEVLLSQMLESTSEGIWGKQANIPLHTERTAGIGARAEGGALQDPGNQEYLNATYNIKYLYGRVRVTGPSMAKTEREVGAFLQSLKSEMSAIRNDLVKDTARQFYGDGTAQIATVANSGSSTTITATSVEAIRKGQIYRNEVVDVGIAGNYDSKLAAGTVSSVDESTGDIVVSSAIDLSSGGPFYLIRSGNAVSSSSVNEIDAGLRKIVNVTAGATVGGVSSTTYPIWDNQRDTAGGTLTVNRLLQMWNECRIAGGRPDLVVTSFGGLRAYFNQLQSQVRYNEPQTIKGGFKTLDFNGLPLVADVDAPYGHVYFLTKEHIKVFTTKDWHWLDEDGDVLKWRSGYDEWEAVIAKYCNLGTDRRNVLGVLTFTDSSGT